MAGKRQPPKIVQSPDQALGKQTSAPFFFPFIPAPQAAVTSQPVIPLLVTPPVKGEAPRGGGGFFSFPFTSTTPTPVIPLLVTLWHDTPAKRQAYPQFFPFIPFQELPANPVIPPRIVAKMEDRREYRPPRYLPFPWVSTTPPAEVARLGATVGRDTLAAVVGDQTLKATVGRDTLTARIEDG